MSIFIDTGAFLAKFLINDQHHKSAIITWNKLQKVKDRFFTTNFILDEMITLLGRWVSEDFSLEKAYSIYNSRSFVILRPDEFDELKALEYYKKFKDKKIGFTDCISFTLMKKHRIEQVFSFDRHFTDVGFKNIGMENFSL
jgi:predicted nucleic acid-binding protein